MADQKSELTAKEAEKSVDPSKEVIFRERPRDGRGVIIGTDHAQKVKPTKSNTANDN